MSRRESEGRRVGAPLLDVTRRMSDEAVVARARKIGDTMCCAGNILNLVRRAVWRYHAFLRAVDTNSAVSSRVAKLGNGGAPLLRKMSTFESKAELNDHINRKEHWNQVYQTKAPDEVSWFQARPTISLKLIEKSGIGKAQGVIDVGGGASVLVDFLLDAGFERPAVLDISAAALALPRQRLRERAGNVEWFEADVTEFNPPRRFALWHDRAVFHFLTDKADRRKYLETLKRTLTPDGHAVIATFAIDGPAKCSGLAVARYDAPAICAELSDEFQLVEQVDETHLTPWGSEQKFVYFLFKKASGCSSSHY